VLTVHPVIMASHAESNLSTWSLLVQSLVAVACLQGIYWSCKEAYQIRLYAIEEYGRVIHEFDPYFNYRATEYLWEHGWLKFRTWFDYLVWYPLGRPVGTTIYPGMQVTSVLIKKYILPDMSINDICCFVPAWFGVTATIACGWLTWECTAANTKSNTKSKEESQSLRYFNTFLNEIPVVREIYQALIVPVVGFFMTLLQKLTGSKWGLESRPVHRLTPAVCAVLSAAIMSIIPGHISRSVGGGYDNESIAMTAMVTTFACWTRSLRNGGSMSHAVTWGIITGLAYSYMVAAWGGYVFVLNLVGVHASLLVALGRYSTKLHRAYTCFYLVGTYLAMQVPVVGMTPLKSVEQMGPLLAFVGMQLIEYCEVARRRKLALGGRPMTTKEMWILRIKVFGVAGIIAVAVAAALWPTGYFGPLSSRVRGLFVKHTKTGNPLVDSVAEHQKAPPDAYGQYLQHAVYISPIAFVTTGLFFFNDSSSFLIVYGIAALFFSARMIRLILLAAPIASAFAGIFLGRFFMWSLGSILPVKDDLVTEDEESITDTSNNATAKRKQQRKESEAAAKLKKGEPLLVRAIRLALSVYAIWWMTPYAKEFHRLSHAIAKQISHPTIIQKAQTQSGKTIMVDDYRDAYLWLKENTPEDARIMAWWDYGYQIAGIANRTTLADGNTWNHEHIALLGYTLTSPEKEAHRIARHLADYVLVWAGGGGDDMNKSPHLRRIANSVYRNICSDPTCRDFNIYVSTLSLTLVWFGLETKILLFGALSATARSISCSPILRHHAHLFYCFSLVCPLSLTVLQLLSCERVLCSSLFRKT
jgi:dolichyl-diphosphooligosaccharide--protein glycosyltransferase